MTPHRFILIVLGIVALAFVGAAALVAFFPPGRSQAVDRPAEAEGRIRVVEKPRAIDVSRWSGFQVSVIEDAKTGREFLVLTNNNSNSAMQVVELRPKGKD